MTLRREAQLVSSGSGQHTARFTGNGLVDHASINNARTLFVCFEHTSVPRDAFGGGRESAVDDRDMRGMNGGLAVETVGDRESQIGVQ